MPPIVSAGTKPLARFRPQHGEDTAHMIRSEQGEEPKVLYGFMPALALLFLMLGISFLVFATARDSALKTAAARFTRETGQESAAVMNRLEQYEAALRAGAAFFESHPRVDRRVWKGFVARMNMRFHYPGIQGLGFARHVVRGEEAAFKAGARAEGHGRFRIYPAGQRDEYYSIIYLEPLDWRNQRAIGYDMYSEEVRRTAIARMRDTGEAALSGKVRLVQETDEAPQNGFLIYVPVYRPGGPFTTVEARRRNIRGTVYSPFRMNDFMEGLTISLHGSDIRMEVYDGDIVERGNLLYSRGGEPPAGYVPRITDRSIVEIGGHRWTLLYSTLPAFDAELDYGKARVLLGAGIVLSLLLFVIILSLFNTRRQALKAATRLAAEVEERASLFHSLAENAPVLIWLTDEAGVTTFLNRQWSDFTGRLPHGEGKTGWEAVIHPEDSITMHALQGSALKRQDAFSAECRLRRRDGEYRWMRLNAQPWRSAAGGFAGFIGSCIDITESKTAFDRVAESERRLLHAQWLAKVGSWEWNIRTGEEKWSEQTFRIFGYDPSADSPSHEAFLKAVHPDDREQLEGAMATALDSYRPYGAEFRILAPGGKVRNALMQGVAMADEEGIPAKLVGTVQDVTGLKREERAVRAIGEFSLSLIKAAGEKELLNEACRIIIERAGYRLAWVGYAREEEGIRVVHPVAQAGFEDGYLETIHVRWDESALGNGPTGVAIRTGRPVVISDIVNDSRYEPWREQAVRRGYQASVALPLLGRGGCLGALNIYAAEPDSFGEFEMRMLKEFSEKLAFGIETLRLREERRKSDEALRRSEERYRAIYDRSAMGIVQARPDGTINHANTSFLDILGYSIEELQTMRWADFTHPEDLRENERFFERMLSGDIDFYKMKKRYIRKDGKAIWANLLVTCTRGPAGEVELVIAMIEDITARVQADESLKQLRDFYSHVLESVKTGVMVTDAQDRITYVNEALSAIAGIPPERFYFKHILNDFSDEVTASVRKGYREARETLQPARIEQGKMVTPGGRPITFAAWLVPLERHGAYDGMICTIDDMTERFEMEERLAASEERYRTLVETADDGISLHDLNYKQLYQNRAKYASLGFSDEEGGALDYMERIHPDDRDQVRREMKNILAEGKGTSEYRIRHKDGRWFIRSARSSLVRDAAGRPQAILSIIRDITEMRQAEEALRESESRFRSALVNSPIPIMLHAEDGQVILLSNRWSELTGYRPEDIPTTARWAEKAYGARKDEVLRGIRQTYTDKKGFQYRGEWQVETADGRLLDWDFYSGTLEPLPDGRALALTMAVDLTDRKMAEAERAAAAQYARTLIESSLDPLATIANDGKIMDVNRATELATGAARGELIGSDFAEYFTEPEKAREGYRRAFRDGEVRDFPLVMRHRDGTQIEVRYNATIYRDTEGEVAGLFAAARDVTALKKAEDRLRAAKEEAEEATLLKDKFVSLVSHDLKGPLSTMMGLLRFALDDIDKERSPKAREIIEASISSGANMTRLIEELLNISRLRTGKIVPKMRFIDAHYLAVKAMVGQKHQAANKGVVLRNDIPARTRIYCDEALMGEVLANLVSNAVKFCRRGDTVTLYEMPDRPGTLVVADTGLGVPAAMQKHLFNYEVKTSRPGSAGEPGTGLGLPLSYDIMRAHKGSLLVESEEGKGSIFYAVLPPVRPLVLVVDDERTLRQWVKMLLREMEVDVLEAEDGRQGLAAMRERVPHLVIVDLNMPVMDGFELLETMKGDASLRELPVVVLTATSDVAVREKVFRMGADDYIVKPVSEDEFLPRIRRFTI